MCGIVGAVAERPVADILLEGLNRLEYRGYDSAGMALLHPKTHQIQCVRVKGKVAALVDSVKKNRYSVKLASRTRAGPRTVNLHKKRTSALF